MRPIRILELRSVRGTGGGPEKTILLGTARTNPDRFAITVCYLRDRRDRIFSIDEWARAIGVPYVEICERRSFDPLVWPRLLSLVRDHHIDIVHAHDYKTNFLAWTMARTGGVLALSTVHGWTGHSTRERRLYYPFDKRVLARFPRLIAVSGDIRDELVRHGAAADRVKVILNGIDHLKFSRDDARAPLIRERLGINPQALVIGSVGRLEPQKRFDLLLEAAARIRITEPRLRLYIVGEGSERSLLERRISERGLGSICTLLGHRTDVADLHHAFDLFVQSSDYEGTPNAVLEAMAMRTPIVATDVGGTSELVVDRVHGLLVRPGNAEQLAATITRALCDRSAMQTRAAAARARIECELSFERRMQRVEEVYVALMAASNRCTRSDTATSNGRKPKI